MAQLRLISLQCFETEDWTGPDEPYLLLNGNQVWGPVSMNKNDRQDLGTVQRRDFSTRVRIDLWEEDTGSFLDPDDRLGTNYVEAAEAGQGEKECEFKLDGANYKLFYEVLG